MPSRKLFTKKTISRRKRYLSGVRARRRLRFKTLRMRRRIPRSLSFFPNSQTVALKFSNYANINPAVGVAGAVIYRANSIYDPDYAISSHQPMFYNQLKDMYQHYVVLGSKITVRYFMQTVANTSGCAVGIKLDDNATISTDIRQIVEQNTKNVKYRFMHNNASYPKNTQKVSQTFSCRKFFGLKNVKDNQFRCGAQFGHNPTEEAFFNCFVAPLDGTTDVPNVNMFVYIRYIVWVSEPKDFENAT